MHIKMSTGGVTADLRSRSSAVGGEAFGSQQNTNAFQVHAKLRDNRLGWGRACERRLGGSIPSAGSIRFGVVMGSLWRGAREEAKAPGVPVVGVLAPARKRGGGAPRKAVAAEVDGVAKQGLTAFMGGEPPRALEQRPARTGLETHFIHLPSCCSPPYRAADRSKPGTTLRVFRPSCLHSFILYHPPSGRRRKHTRHLLYFRVPHLQWR